MVWDLAVLLEDPKGQQTAYGGKKAYYLFILHHAFSIYIWPYAILAGRCVYFVNFFLVSEVTNSNMATRWFLLKCKLESSTFYVLNGLAWIPLFLGVRVLVIPSMLQAFIFGSWNALSPGEKIVAFTTLPIPSMLNVYWSRMIVMNAVKCKLPGRIRKIQRVLMLTMMPRHQWEILRRQRRRRRTNTEKIEVDTIFSKHSD